MPISRPGNVTSIVAPSVLTLHDVALNDARARRTSAADRGSPMLRPASGSAGRPPPGSKLRGRAASAGAAPRPGSPNPAPTGPLAAPRPRSPTGAAGSGAALG